MGNFLNRYTCGFLLLAFIAIAPISGFIAFTSAYKTSETPYAQGLLDGTWQKTFEKKFSESLAFYDSARLFMGDISYKLFKEGRHGVVVGKDGWLFSNEEFQVSRHDRKNYQLHLNFIEKTHRDLQNDDVKVLIAIVPSKARVNDRYLGGRTLPHDKEIVLNQFTQDLKARHIDFISLAPVLGGDGYLKTDTHWSQSGAEASARMIARELRPVCGQCDEDVKNIKGKSDLYSGDLLKYLPVSDIEPLKSDRVWQYELTSSAEPDLFDDKMPDIVVVGTSYSQRREFNFENFLKEYMRSDVLNMAKEGKGPFVAMKEYLEEKTYDPKILIWEIPERYLAMAD